MKILKSILFLGVIALVAFIGTSAFFSDEETSVGNTFQAGAIDLLIDSEAHYNGMVCTSDGEGGYTWQPEENFTPGPNHYPATGTSCAGSWELTDLHTLASSAFFNYSDLKPGDHGENTISLHVNNNDAYMCAIIDNMQDDDNGLTEPEQEDGDDTDGPNNGELASELRFFAWADDGDNIWEEGELPLFSNTEGPASDVLDGVVYPMFTPQTEVFPGGQTRYIGLYWCYGQISTEGGVLSCDGSEVTNISQTDSLTADIAFYVEQARNNPDFTCPEIDSEPQIMIGANLGAYTAPTTCDVTVPSEGITTIQQGVNAAAANETVCVDDGTYAENVNITTTGLKLAALNAPISTATINGRVRVNATNVAVTGFEILGANVSGENTNGVYVVAGSTNLQLAYNVIDGSAHASGQRRGIHFETPSSTNPTITHNVLKNWGSTGLFFNPTAGPVSVTYNDFFNNNVGIGSDGLSNATVSRNAFNGNSAEAFGLGTPGAGNVVTENNFVPAGAGNNVNWYGPGSSVVATHNWWDGEADTARTNNITEIVTEPAAPGAFPEN